MPNQLTLAIQPGQLASGFCPASYQEMLNGFSGAQTVIFPVTFTGITVSSTKPTDTTQAWLRLDTLGRPSRIYYFAQGAWLSPHPLQPDMAIPWFDVVPSLTSYDGGDASAISAVSGPMWEVVTEMAAKFPLATGNLPISGISVAVGDAGGEEKHTLTSAEMPPHVHDITQNLFSDSLSRGGQTCLAKNPQGDGTGPATLITDSTGGSGTPAAAQAHQNLPPYFGMTWLRRTDRLFYIVP